MAQTHVHVQGAADPKFIEDTTYRTIDVKKKVPEINARIAKMMSTKINVRFLAFTMLPSGLFRIKVMERLFYPMIFEVTRVTFASISGSLDPRESRSKLLSVI